MIPRSRIYTDSIIQQHKALQVNYVGLLNVWLQVSQADKYENAAGEASVVITLASDARKLLVTKPARFAQWIGRNPVIVLGEQHGKTLMKDWNKTATKTITTSTVGDFVKASRSASTQQAAVDAMMKLA